MIRDRGPGQALVEFALVIPVFLMILLGLVDLGRAVFVASSLTNAAREGARIASVNQDKPLVTQRTLEQTLIATPDVTVDFYQPMDDPAADPSTGGVCGSFDEAGHVVSAPSIGCVAVVTTTDDLALLTPVVSQLVGTLTLRSKSVASIAFPCPDPVRPGFPFPTPESCPRQP